MRSRLRGSITAVAASLVAAASLGGMAASASAASGPGSFQLKAQGDALSISGFGTTLTGGDSTISADATPSADAVGSGQLLPTVSGSQHATATTPGQNQNLPLTCAAPTLPAPLSTYLSAGLGCGSAQAATDGNGLPSAGSAGSVAQLTAGAGSALTQIITAGSPVFTALQGILGTLPTPPVGGISLGDLLTSLGLSVAQTTGLATISAGTSTGSVSTTAASATATNTSSGGTIAILPGAGGPGLPAASITLGAATTTATLDRSGGAGTATASPSVVTVTVNNPVTGSNTITLAPGQSQTLLSGTPLASTISVGSSNTTQGPGSATATAQGVVLSLLTGLPGGGITIDLASSSASVTGLALAAAVTPPAAPPAAAPAPPAGAPIAGVTAVHTGEPWGGSLPIIALALVAGLGLIYRRRLAALIPVLAHGTRAIGSPLGAAVDRARCGLRYLAGLARGGSGR
ncbi:MAG TPA: hypothetical protein VNV87_05620 [Acidimicrobiales bacterium]|jgi:hypothetical protein|nr:hypothetical protein [Acidimicrobiales bacterium]